MKPYRVVPFVAFLLVVTLCAGTVLLLDSCSSVDCKDPKNAGSAACVVKDALVTCAKAEVEQGIADHGQEIKDAIAKITNPDGSINKSGVLGALKDLGLKYGGCVVAAVFEGYVLGTAKSSSSGSGSAVAVATPDAARQAFGDLAKDLWPGKKYQLPSGTVLP